MAINILSPSFWIGLLSMASLSAAGSQATPQVSQLFQFTYPTSVQNLLPLPNDCLLLSTSATSNLYYINPGAIYPSAQNVITLPGSTALTGLAALGDGLYAVTGSGSGGMQVHVVKVATEGQVTATLDHSIKVADASSMDGMAALPKHPRTILSADSVKGRIMRVDTSSNAVTVAFEHGALKPGTNNAPDGVKGLEINGDHLYFTNPGQGTFGRFPIDEFGGLTGDVEVLAHLNDVGGSTAYGDFAFDGQGNAFVAVHPSSVRKIAPNGAQSTFVGGTDSTFLEPTSVILSRDGKSIYVSTGGKNTGFPNTGGQLMKVQYS